ncbi:MAG: class I SAM-dependent methyltransferase [Nitrososphaerota archaeon]|nr:class I SAM-dependent methyltransferase [Nitrososphaerota archaeon]
MYYKGEKIDRPSFHHNDFHGYGDKIKRELGKHIPRNRKLRVLDIGTGFGAVAGFLSKHLSKSSKLWTVDPAREMLEGAKMMLAKEGLDKRIPIEFVKADASNLDFEDGFFDIVVSVMVLHHVQDLNSVLKELLRVLKKGGKLILVDYVPKASMILEFHRRHAESDFFEPKMVAESIKQIGSVKVRLKNAKLWYLVESVK